MKIYACRISELLKEEADILPLLDEKRRIKVQGMLKNSHKVQTIIAGLLLRYAYQQEKTDIEWEQLDICEEENGKPYFANQRDMFFSISHSKEFCVVVISKVPIGVDIEKRRTYKSSIAERFFLEQEKQQFLNVDENKKQELFYSIWCGKEACSKIEGTGIPKGLSRFLVCDYENAIDLDKEKRMLLKHYEDLEGYEFVCSMYEEDANKNNARFLNSIKLLDQEQLY